MVRTEQGEQDSATDPEVGKAPPLRSTNGYVPAGAVTEVSAPRVLEYAWLHEDEPVGRVRWELSYDDEVGSRLVLTQTVPAHLARLLPVALAAWQVHLELFFAALHGEIRCPWPTERTDELTRRYAERS
ncbi:hypothetical protein [Amycolatopsis arida]|uniref:hypothetical protein n=1 Tax=Amycolatopsis arida TaxID=587909 RepID=UPI00106591CA|nr:hypothetical protein [Amycolatopsis arida]